MEITIRPYQSEDLIPIVNLFETTVREINKKDYSPQQIQVWSQACQKFLRQPEFFSRLYTLVAVREGQIVGYGNMDTTGYLDLLFVHKDWQNHKVASAICDHLEAYGSSLGVHEITVHASITAKPFFEKRNYVTIKENQAVLQGIALTNYYMAKQLRS